MTKNDVMNMLKNMVSTILDDIEVELRVFNKNNGATYIGLLFHKDKDEFNVSPVMDITDIVNRIVKNQLSMNEASDMVVEMYNRNTLNFRYEINRDDILDTAFIELINYDMNKEMLENIPFDRYLDFAIIYRFKPDIDGIDGSIIINNEILKMMDIGIDEVREAAYLENDLDNCIISQISDFLHIDGYDDAPMFICTRPEMSYGARVILNKELFRRFGCDLWIIPSSIHEVIVLPADKCGGNYIRGLIEHVNATVVDTMDVLSNNLYFYDYALNEIRIA